MIKMGVALGGGGARGSYQLGVLKALMEENLLDDLKVVSGTSIGSFNAGLLMEQMSFDEMYYVWEQINNGVLYKESFDNFKTSRLGMFDQTKMYDILVNYSNKENIKNSPIKGYVAACKIGNNGIINQLRRSHMESKLLKLNKNKNPHKAILASSSIPIVFGATEIDGDYYVDGGMLNMVPINALEKENCNLMIVISLNKHNRYKLKDENILLIDLSPKVHISVTPLGILDFSKENLDTRIELGYQTALAAIEELKNDGIIQDGKWNLNQRGIYKK